MIILPFLLTWNLVVDAVHLVSLVKLTISLAYIEAHKFTLSNPLLISVAIFLKRRHVLLQREGKNALCFAKIRFLFFDWCFKQLLLSQIFVILI